MGTCTHPEHMHGCPVPEEEQSKERKRKAGQLDLRLPSSFKHWYAEPWPHIMVLSAPSSTPSYRQLSLREGSDFLKGSQLKSEI